jgi:hypothetical protein
MSNQTKKWAHYLIKVDEAPIWGENEDDYQPSNWVTTNNDGIYLHAELGGGETPTIFAQPELVNPVLVGAWDYDGAQVALTNIDEYTTIRPLGNAPPQPIYDEDGNETGMTSGGEATPDLYFHCFAGARKRMLEPDSLYPAANKPFEIKIKRHYFEEGDYWGWLGGILNYEDARDATLRNIGEYSDSECTDLLFNTDNFVLTSIEEPAAQALSTQEETENIFLVASPAPASGATVSAADETSEIHVALLSNDVQEGFITLPEGKESVVKLFWENMQVSS